MSVQANRSNLEHYGINPLTGEACSYSHRILCDLNKDGVRLLCDYLGIFPEAFPKNWNSTVNGKPAVASFMMPRAMFNDLSKFIILHVEKSPYMIEAEHINGDSGWCGYDDNDLGHYPILAEFLEAGKLFRNWSINSSQPQVNGRNVHGFTGRTV